MYVNIRIELDNDAFVQDCEGELSDILGKLPVKIAATGLNSPRLILDTNGNTVGSFSIGEN